MLEHKWDGMRECDEDVQQFLQPCPVRLRYSAGEGEQIHCVDVTSSYLYVNAACAYPLGHLKTILSDFKDPREYFGLIKAVVIPPRGLSLPVLSYRTPGGKRVFTLCCICADGNIQDAPCKHTNEERALTGTWVNFVLGLDRGYRVVKLLEVWQFEEKTDAVFKGYINSFLKGKQEASGYPPDVMNEES